MRDLEQSTLTCKLQLLRTLARSMLYFRFHTGLYGNPHSRMHPYGWETKKVIDIAREHVAKLNGAYPKGILFTTGATGSYHMSVRYVAGLYRSKKHIIASQTEHKCVLDLCQHLQDEGYDITYLPIENNGLINLEHLEKEICTDTALVSIMTVNNEIEVIQQMEEIRKLYRKHGVFFRTNGVQVMGKIPVEVSKWNVDWVSISGPKVYGLKRIGACYIRCRLKVRIGPLISGGGQEHVLRSGTLAPSLVIGFGEAHRIVQEEIEYTRTSEPFFSQHSICSSTMQGDNYMRKGYHNKQPKQFTRTFRTMSHTKADTKKGKRKATSKDSTVGILEANDSWVKVHNTKEDQKTDKKRRNLGWTTSYSKITIREAENLLGIRLALRGIPVKQMLEGKHGLLGPDAILEAKREVYKGLVRYLDAEGYPTESDPDFKEANINDIVAFTIYPILALFKHETTRKLHLSREKEIISKDSSTSGMQEFVVMDYISHNEMKYILIVEAKKVSLGDARKQCFLSLKDMRDCNGGGTVYGFITIGDSWRMISFDGEFKLSNKIELLFDSMGEDEEQWMADYSILVECLNVALSNGAKDLVEVV
ncbi:PLP-dependent transferase [Choiromyces venosus 120613-1]|uniref:PLP-dependent transferase n=1 Tax=Choiromyces venosus 120613-1 TaxID=1336337 RepID=A0A3N4IZM4_9PEZI|nr:PLP-dependent transferase [Choiromyces venosus 120613-1]